MSTLAIYQHHERTTLAAVVADLQTRELGIDGATGYLVASSQNLAAVVYVPSATAALTNSTILKMSAAGRLTNSTITDTGTVITVGSGATVSIANTTDATTTATGCLVLSGGMGVAKALWVGGLANITGVVTLTASTQSTTSATGAVLISGGVGIVKNLNVGGVAGFGGNSSVGTAFGVGAGPQSPTQGAGVTQRGILVQAVGGTDAVTSFTGIYVNSGTQVACTNYIGIDILTPNFLSTASTTSYGLKIEDQSGAATIYALYTGIGLVNIGDNLAVVRSTSGSTVNTQISNTSNTASSDARLNIIVAGSSAGNPFTRFDVNGVTAFSIGLNNAATGDPFTISNGGTLGTTDLLILSTAGAYTFNTNGSFLIYGATAASETDIIIKSSRGTIASPTNVVNGDYTMTFGSQNYSGGTYFTGANIDIAIDAAVVNGQAPATRLEFYTNKVNTTQALALKIDNAGLISASNTTDATSAIAAALVTAGGLGVAKKLYVGTSIFFANGTVGMNWYDSGTFTATITGCTTSPTVTAQWERIGNVVTLRIPAITATSNSTACTLTGMSTNAKPATAQSLDTTGVEDNTTVYGVGGISIATSGTITLQFEALITGGLTSTFTASGTKGLNRDVIVTYLASP